MALAAIWPLPVAFAIVALASGVQKRLSSKAMAAKITCEDGIQECMETMPDLRANNAEAGYLAGLEKKIRAVEGRLIKSELGTAAFVVSAGLVLRLGIATTALAGAALLVKGELDVYKRQALEDVSFSIGSGQTVAFVGPSGGGKSTLAALIARFFDPQSGSISIGGINVKNIDKNELMETVSFVFQNSHLIKGSILDNVRMGKPDATDEEVLAALRAAQCMDIIEKFPDGVHTVIGSQGI